MDFRWVEENRKGYLGMIILIGPDGSGKSTLAHRLQLPCYHFTQHSKYGDYLVPLARLELMNAVLDRHAICEYSYSIVMKRQFGFTIKEWHNLLLLTLAQNPLIVLCTNKPKEADYPADQYMPYALWDRCLELYKYFLDTNHIRYIEYDYTNGLSISRMLEIDLQNRRNMEWWVPMWQSGWGFAGSTYPEFLLVGERQGPNNPNNIPFQSGPTGFMLSRVLFNTGTPLGALAITNMVKSHRRDTRKVNDRDLELLHEEILNLKPKKVIFMGSPAKLGIPVARELNCETGSIIHLGALNHRGIKDLTNYYNEWRALLGMRTKIEYK